MSTVAFANPRMTLLDKTKGNFQNRLECSAEHLKNDVKTATGVAIGAGTGAFVGHTIYKAGLKDTFAPQVNSGIKKVYANVQDKFVPLIQQKPVEQFVKKSDAWINKVTKNTMPKFSPKFKTKGAKTGFAIAAGAAVLSVICGLISHFYNKGQIDQKYTDKANQKKALHKAEQLKLNEMNDIIKQNNEYDAFMQAVVNARKY